MAGEQFLQSTDGTQIYVKKFDAAEPAKAQLLVLHGYLEHCLRYTEFAEYLAKNHHISVTLYDFRGHGKSGGDRPVIRKWEEYEEDFEVVRSTMEPNLPLFILGHSNGGLTVLHYLLSHEIKGIRGAIVTNPYVEATDAVPFFVLFIVHALGRWIPKLRVASNLKAKDLTSCPIKQEEHQNDTQVQYYASIGWASQALKAQSRVQQWAASKIIFPVPLLYVYSTDDKVANPKTVKVVGEALQSGDKTIICREGEEHEVLNEIKREETYDAISSWILERM